jgi:hypothetical protein
VELQQQQLVFLRRFLDFMAQARLALGRVLGVLGVLVALGGQGFLLDVQGAIGLDELVECLAELLVLRLRYFVL